MTGIDILVSKIIRKFGNEVVWRKVVKSVDQATGHRVETYEPDKIIIAQVSQLTGQESEFTNVGNFTTGDFLVSVTPEHSDIQVGDYIRINKDTWTEVAEKVIRRMNGVENYVELLCRRVAMKK